MKTHNEITKSARKCLSDQSKTLLKTFAIPKKVKMNKCTFNC